MRLATLSQNNIPNIHFRDLEYLTFSLFKAGRFKRVNYRKLDRGVRLLCD